MATILKQQGHVNITLQLPTTHVDISVDGSHFTVFFCITGPLGGKPIPLKSILYSKQPAFGKLMKEGQDLLSVRENAKIPTKAFLATYVLHK